MNTATKLGIAIGATVVVGGAAISLGLFGGPSDKEQIQKALDEAILASKEGRPGGVVEYISAKFQVNDAQYGTRDIAKAVKDLRPTVEIANREPSIAGNIASITSSVKLSVSLPPVNVNLQNVKMSFERENSRKWLIFPSKTWRMTQVDIPEETFNEVRDQFSGISQL